MRNNQNINIFSFFTLLTLAMVLFQNCTKPEFPTQREDRNRSVSATEISLDVVTMEN